MTSAHRRSVAVSIGTGTMGTVLCPGRGVVHPPPVASHARDRVGQRGGEPSNDPKAAGAQEPANDFTLRGAVRRDGRRGVAGVAAESRSVPLSRSTESKAILCSLATGAK